MLLCTYLPRLMVPWAYMTFLTAPRPPPRKVFLLNLAGAASNGKYPTDERMGGAWERVAAIRHGFSFVFVQPQRPQHKR